MAPVEPIPRSGRIVLDAGAVLALARGDVQARARLREALSNRPYVVVLPTPVLAQVHRGGRDHAQVDRVIAAVDALVAPGEEVARRAGELMARTGTTDAVDAMVAAEALAAAPSIVLTSDPADIRRLIEGEPESDRVLVVGV